MRRIATPSSFARVAIAAMVMTAVASCGTSNPAANPAPVAGASSPAASSSAAAVPSAVVPSPAASSAAAANCYTGGWRSAPVSVTRHVAVPPVPGITAVRTAAHPECGYDRLVLDITGPMPSYSIRYVSQVTADPSGKPVALPGRSFLLITLRPAQAHASPGAPTIARPAKLLGYPALKGYALAGDFEGVVTLALGLHHTTSIRVGEIPGHWYVDVKA